MGFIVAMAWLLKVTRSRELLTSGGVPDARMSLPLPTKFCIFPQQNQPAKSKYFLTNIMLLILLIIILLA
jgi:hypothetical protein